MCSATLVLALVASACSSAAQDTPTTIPFTLPSPVTTTGQETEGDYLWQVGDCLSFGVDATLVELPYAPYGSEPLVECSDLKFAHSLRFVFARMIAPASLS